MKTFKFKRSLSAATAAIMTLSVMTGVVPGVVNKFAGNVEMSVSATDPMFTDGVAEVGTADAIRAAVTELNTKNDTVTGNYRIKLTDNILIPTQAEYLKIQKKVTIDLNGHTLSCGDVHVDGTPQSEDRPIVAFGSDADVTFINGTIKSNDEYVMNGQSRELSGACMQWVLCAENGGHLTIESDVTVNAKDGTFVSNGAGSLITIKSASVTSDSKLRNEMAQTYDGGKIIVDIGTGTIDVKNQRAFSARNSTAGSTIILNSGTIKGGTKDGGEILGGNTSVTLKNPALYVKPKCTIIINNAVVTGNKYGEYCMGYDNCSDDNVKNISLTNDANGVPEVSKVIKWNTDEEVTDFSSIIKVAYAAWNSNNDYSSAVWSETKPTEPGDYVIRVQYGDSSTESDKTSTLIKKFNRTRTPSHSVDYETVTEDGVTYYVYSDRAEAAEVDTSIKSAVIKSKVGGENVTAIGENAFNSCAVETVTIPETVTEIRNSAFWGCSALKKITIPKTVGYIGKDAFKRCSALEEISGYTGSAAETFAKSSNIKFVPLDGAVTTVSSTDAPAESTTGATTTTAVVTDNVKPGAPTNVKVDKNGNVTWDAADNAAYYKIVKVVKEKGVEKSYGVVVKDGTSGKISVPASDYRVYVAAFASNGSKTNSASVQVKVDKPLGYVNDPTVDAEGNVTFTAAENAVNYKIGKIVNGKTYYSKEFSGTTGTIKVPKTDYKIFVVAIDKDGKKTWGKIVDVELPLGTVTDPKVSSDGKVTWSAVRGAVSYKVGKKYTNSKGKAATGYTSLITDGKTEANIKLMKGENKVFVVAFDKDGNKTWGSKVTVVKE